MELQEGLLRQIVCPGGIRGEAVILSFKESTIMTHLKLLVDQCSDINIHFIN